MVVRPPATDVSFILRYIYVIVDCFLHSGSWILSGCTSLTMLHIQEKFENVD